MVSILDCTLRDGGYYNRWDFDRAIVDRYLTAVKASFVDVVELGKFQVDCLHVPSILCGFLWHTGVDAWVAPLSDPFVQGTQPQRRPSAVHQ